MATVEIFNKVFKQETEKELRLFISQESDIWMEGKSQEHVELSGLIIFNI